MKTSLEHLPEEKQLELRHATDTLVEATKPEMVVLFGSYARGDWVEEMDADDLYFKYQSDFDLLVVVKHESQAAKIARNLTLERRLNRPLKTPVSLIAEDISHINRRLEKGHYFFSDIKREGIILYDSGTLGFSEPRELSTRERQNLALQDLEYWLTSADEFRDDYLANHAKARFNKAAFYLHQATECLYSAILLVFTRYKPNTHDLHKLEQRAASVNPRFLTVFPRGSAEQQRRFELLRSAYVDARYKRSFCITAEQLEWLYERVQDLRSLTESLCKQRIDDYAA